MWTYNKMLQYPINIKCTDPRLAKVIISQYGGPDGELILLRISKVITICLVYYIILTKKEQDIFIINLAPFIKYNYIAPIKSVLLT